MQRPVSWSLHAETAVEGAKDRERAQQRRELLNLGAGHRHQDAALLLRATTSTHASLLLPA